MKRCHNITECLVIHADEVKYGSKIRYKHPKLSIERRTLSSLPSGFIRVQMIFTGVCGTDTHLVKKDRAGFVSTSAPLQIPEDGRIFGHEGVGRIVEVGSGVTHFFIGDIVALESIITCGFCNACRLGHFNQCLNAKLIGMQTDGLFSEVVDIPESVAYKVNEMAVNEYGLEAAACLEPASVAWLACHNLKISAGDRVLIFGGGPIGYFCAMLAKLVFGASWIGLVEPIKYRRAHVSAWCDEVFDTESLGWLEKKYDVIIEASGFLANIRETIRTIKANGRVALLARSGEPLVVDDIDHIITNAISIIGVRGHLGGVFGRLIELFQYKQLPLHKVVTDKLSSLQSLKESLIEQTNLTQENCKVLVDFRDSSNG